MASLALQKALFEKLVFWCSPDWRENCRFLETFCVCVHPGLFVLVKFITGSLEFSESSGAFSYDTTTKRFECLKIIMHRIQGTFIAYNRALSLLFSYRRDNSQMISGHMFVLSSLKLAIKRSQSSYIDNKTSRKLGAGSKMVEHSCWSKHSK